MRIPLKKISDLKPGDVIFNLGSGNVFEVEHVRPDDESADVVRRLTIYNASEWSVISEIEYWKVDCRIASIIKTLSTLAPSEISESMLVELNQLVKIRQEQK